ncbi:hypothetical protein LTR56_022117 [Elasticomyces elasticus]|nr:hypothetical protein LTR56_022117 [Elasticomyces elasticus]KAK3642007.1 hypothetical protein LTR22_016332 [Elasticomyces elasticus]KAK5748851.1 hypothetical protein LTS12_021089 [Elasticomyces elasticus]
MEAALQPLQLQDHIIKLVIGDLANATTFHVSQNLLEQTAEYFKIALRNQHLGSCDERDTLHFPEDDLHAWMIFLYWIMRQQLPDIDDLNFLPQTAKGETAILGDKYGVPEFQDRIMLQLLYLLECNTLRLDTIKEAFEHTPPGSVLRELMAEELANMLQVFDTAEYSDLDMFDGIAGFASVLMKKTQAAGMEGECVFRPRVPALDGSGFKGDSPFTLFLVGKSSSRKSWASRVDGSVERRCTFAQCSNGAEPFHVPQNILEATSHYFKKALIHDGTLGMAAPDTLTFPTDSEEAWKVLLHWIFKHDLLEDEQHRIDDCEGWELLMVECWAMGDRSHHAGTARYPAAYTSFETDTIKQAFATTPAGCTLRMVMAELVAAHLQDEIFGLGPENRNEFEGYPGCLAEIDRAVKEWSGTSQRIVDEDARECCVMSTVEMVVASQQLHFKDQQGVPRWKKFMVAGGPEVHWVHQSPYKGCVKVKA